LAPLRIAVRSAVRQSVCPTQTVIARTLLRRIKKRHKSHNTRFMNAYVMDLIKRKEKASGRRDGSESN
jgi:hypothetical protein